MKKWVIIGVTALVIITVAWILLAKACSTVGIVTDPNRMVYNYEWFYNTEADAKAYAQQIVVAKNNVANFKSEHQNSLDNYINSVELANLDAIEQGLQNELVSTCNNYDAAAADITRGMFRNWNLPTGLTATSDGQLIINNN